MKNLLLFKLLLCVVLSFNLGNQMDGNAAVSIKPQVSPNLITLSSQLQTSTAILDTTPPASSQPSSPASMSSEQDVSLSELGNRYPKTFRFRGPREKRIALTFDDVPDPRFTGQILDILSAKGVRATFFIVGSRAEKYPDLVKRMQREGHAIGNHSYNHPNFSKQQLPYFQNQIERTNNVIEQIIGYRPKIIRPPYGEITEKQLQWAKKKGYTVVNWNVDSKDWMGIDAEEVKKNILTNIGPGAIVLQHAGGGVGSDLSGTIKALPDIIDEMKRRGYSFSTVPELLRITTP